MRRATVAAAAAALLAGAAVPALAARVAPSGTAVFRGGTILIIGTGFAPPNEFCSRPTLRVDGRPAQVTGRIFDDVGGWAFRVKATQKAGNHVAEIRQVCESGATGAKTTTRARAPFRILA